MKRKLLITSLLLVVGCQSQQRGPTPDDLSYRLAVVERARLSTFSDEVSVPASRGVAADRVMPAQSNRPPAREAWLAIASDQDLRGGVAR